MKPSANFLFLAFFSFGFSACAPSITREKVMATAYAYAQVEWLPTAINVRHGNDSAGIRVDTPDRDLQNFGEQGGWWTPGVLAKGMPYQWGGFDTPESFVRAVGAGKKAGDIATQSKRRLGDAVVSSESAGIDCSGFISRCWGLPKPYSTRELPQICERLASWEELQPGDVLLKDGQHVLLFERWGKGGTEIVGYEAGPKPIWRVNSCGILKSRLLGEGYQPWRYRKMPAALPQIDSHAGAH